MFVELHIIQNFAPSNLNRDDTGNPKEAEFGGVRRARISSQAIKRAIRWHESFSSGTGVKPSVRTKKLANDLFKRMEVDEDLRQDAEILALEFAKVFSSQKGKMDENEPEKTSVLIFLADQELREIAQQLVLLDFAQAASEVRALDQQKFSKPEARVNKSPLYSLAKEWVKKTQGRTSAPDIALYGRMLADDPKTNIDAASQVAHALSTHRMNMEIDFFTAVDDLQPAEETGAAMIGVTGFNSACFYRYARIDWKQLVKNLDGDGELARRTVAAFFTAALRAIPTGKQNSFAAQNPPSFALAVTRTDGASWNLVNAFEKPVRPDREGGYVAPSVSALDAYWERLGRYYGNTDVKPHVLNVEEVPLNALKEAELESTAKWIASILAALPAQ